MIEEKETFSQFGIPFQEKLAFTILEDHQFAGQIGEVINYNFFEQIHLRVFVKLIYEYKKEYAKYPTRTTFESILRTKLSNESTTVQDKIRKFYARFMESGNTIDIDFVKSNSIEFCKKQKLKEAMIRSAELLKTSSFEEIRSVIDTALKLGVNPDIGYDYQKQFEERYQIQIRNTTTTGWKVIDNMTRGGLANGELGVVIAPTGAGKTHVLCHLGAAAIKEGRTVIHYSLELDDKTIGRRYDAAITKIPLDALYSRKHFVEERLKEVNGSLIIKEYPTKSATTDTIRNHLAKLKERGIEPGMIIIDYADLLRPVNIRQQKREELETIYEEIRAIAKQHNCICYTASQTNRSALKEPVITMDAISEAFNKCFVADFIFTVSRTVDDKRTNTGRVFVAKNRFGTDGIICPIKMDTSNVQIEILEPTDDTMEDIKNNYAKDQGKKISNKYFNGKEESSKPKALPTLKNVDAAVKSLSKASS